MGRTDFIVAVELGSAKIKAMAGRKNTNNTLQLLATAETKTSGCIEKGVILNIDKTAQGIQEVLTSLEQQLGMDISKVYVAVNGQSLHSIKYTTEKELEEDTKISQSLIDTLMEEYKQRIASEQEVLEIIPQEYKVGSTTPLDPVGIQTDHIQANFLNIVARRTLCNNIRRCFDQLPAYQLVEIFIAPIITADALLEEKEKRSGVAVVDLGAETTSVVVYHGNILRHLVVLPLGSRNITRDLATVANLQPEEAEEIKVRFASAYTEDPQDKDYNTKEYSLSNGTSIKVRTLEEVVEARINEILQNVDNQLKLSGYKDKLLDGIVLTGGGAQLPNLETACTMNTDLSLVRTVLLAEDKVGEDSVNLQANGTYNTLLGILLNGKENCKRIDPNADLFEAERVEAERAKREEEERLKREEEERKATAVALIAQTKQAIAQADFTTAEQTVASLRALGLAEFAEETEALGENIAVEVARIAEEKAKAEATKKAKEEENLNEGRRLLANTKTYLLSQEWEKAEQTLALVKDMKIAQLESEVLALESQVITAKSSVPKKKNLFQKGKDFFEKLMLESDED